MRIHLSEVPEHWRKHFRFLDGHIRVDAETFQKFRDEANTTVPHLTAAEKHAWAAHAALTHPHCQRLEVTLRKAKRWYDSGRWYIYAEWTWRIAVTSAVVYLLLR